jgi:hypothetical protein
MDESNSSLWLAFAALANTYPNDNGVRMTQDLARWLMQEQHMAALPAPPIMLEVLGKVVQDSAAKPDRPQVTP